MVAVKQADRQASRILKKRSSKPKKNWDTGILSCPWRAIPIFPGLGARPQTTLVRPLPRLCPLIRSSCDRKPSDQTVVRPKKLCDHSATQKTSDQTIVRLKFFVRLWCDPNFCATLVRPTLALVRPFLNTCYNPLLFV